MYTDYAQNNGDFIGMTRRVANRVLYASPRVTTWLVRTRARDWHANYLISLMSPSLPSVSFPAVAGTAELSGGGWDDLHDGWHVSLSLPENCHPGSEARALPFFSCTTEGQNIARLHRVELF